VEESLPPRNCHRILAKKNPDNIREPFRQEIPPEVDPLGKIRFAVIRFPSLPPNFDDKAGKGISINHHRQFLRTRTAGISSGLSITFDNPELPQMSINHYESRWTKKEKAYWINGLTDFTGLPWIKK
jgi:hypothetical protein